MILKYDLQENQQQMSRMTHSTKRAQFDEHYLIAFFHLLPAITRVVSKICLSNLPMTTTNIMNCLRHIHFPFTWYLAYLSHHFP